MFNKKLLSYKLLLVTALSIIFLAQSSNAYAWSWPSGRNHRRHHYRSIRSLPHNYISILIGGLKFYYRDGLFYRKGLRGYVVVSPPIGAVIDRLPIGYQILFINGNTYYYYIGAYYKACPSGYVVISTPVVFTPKAVVIESAKTTPVTKEASAETIVINIPNSAGTYTPVVLEKADKGYIGPQGEYYPDNPTVEQLKVLYGK